jgi:hypothetical protein
MKNENLPQESGQKREDCEKQNISADDLKFMRSVMEKTYRKVKPETHDAIMWGLICMVAYISIHFLSKHGLGKWITPMYLSLIGLGICGSFVTMLMWVRRQKKQGFVPILPFKAVGVVMVIMFPIIFLDMVGAFKDIFCGAGLIYAMGMSTVMGICGVLYSKAGFLGEIIILAGILLAFFTRDFACPFIILGLATGAGVIVTAIITDISYRKWEKENAES